MLQCGNLTLISKFWSVWLWLFGEKSNLHHILKVLKKDFFAGHKIALRWAFKISKKTPNYGRIFNPYIVYWGATKSAKQNEAGQKNNNCSWIKVITAGIIKNMTHPPHNFAQDVWEIRQETNRLDPLIVKTVTKMLYPNIIYHVETC